jgi:tetratricopeptide (TPR) repeat protein
MCFRLWEAIKSPDNRAVISWLGGGAVVVAAGIWTVVTFVVEHKEAHDKKGDTNIIVSGQGIASGGNTTIGGNVTIGLDEKAVVALVARLIAERQIPAAPGEEKRIGEAVQSIAQGAASDTRLQQALDLLKANKIAEASQLLRAFAEEKTAHAETDWKVAAIAYRNLGAIAGLADPKRALEAYEKAVALDPDDLVSSLGAGWIEVNYGDLNKAQIRLERVLTLAKTDAQASYWALIGIGDIKEQRGDLAGALKSYNGSLAIRDRMATSGPGNAEWQYELGISNERIGTVQMVQGDLASALKSYEAKRDIIARLAKLEPGKALWQSDLSASYNFVGNVQMARGDLAGARKSYQDDHAIIDRLAKLEPGNARWQRDLAVSFIKIGDVQKAQGSLAGALKSYEDSLAIFERLAKSDPGNAGWQRDLAISFERLTLVHQQSGDNAKALDSLRHGQAIMARLTKLSPDNATWKQDLAWFNRVIAELAAR